MTDLLERERAREKLMHREIDGIFRNGVDTRGEKSVGFNQLQPGKHSFHYLDHFLKHDLIMPGSSLEAPFFAFFARMRIISGLFASRSRRVCFHLPCPCDAMLVTPVHANACFNFVCGPQKHDAHLISSHLVLCVAPTPRRDPDLVRSTSR